MFRINLLETQRIGISLYIKLWKREEITNSLLKSIRNLPNTGQANAFAFWKERERITNRKRDLPGTGQKIGSSRTADILSTFYPVI